MSFSQQEVPRIGRIRTYKHKMDGSTARLGKIAKEFLKNYGASKTQLKVIDSYLVFTVLVGLIQFAYMSLVGTFPFNSFLAGFLGAVGAFVLGGKQIQSTNRISLHFSCFAAIVLY